MTHVHKKTGMTFECGELVEPDRKKTYDIIVITYWPDADSGAESPVELVDYYFGEYDAAITDTYIDKWLEVKHAKRIA